MNKFVPKLVGGDERARESRDDGVGAALRPAAPGESTSDPSSPAPAPADASKVETGLPAAGFTSVIRDLSLRGWLRWIHSNRSNATLLVHTVEGTGKVWCSRGDVVDAEWNERIAEEALREMLLLPSGTVTIDFDRVERRRRILRSTHELLQAPDGEPLAVTEAMHAEAVLAAAPTSSASSEPFRQSLLLATGNLPLPTRAPSRRPSPPRRRFSRNEYAAGALVLVALAIVGFSLGRLRGSNDLAQVDAAQSATQQTKSGLRPPSAARADSPLSSSPPKPRELPVIPFMPLEVEPEHAQIWLDGKLVGTGRVQLGAIRDGVLHELRFVAPGHETQTLFFRDTPPSGRVLMKHVGDSAAETARAPTNLAAATQAGSNPADAEQEAAKKLAHRRPAAPPPAPARAAPRAPAAAEAPAPPPPPAPAPPAASAVEASTPKKPQVQLIEVHTPRVQVLD